MLTDVEHVEAVALIRALAERLLPDFPGNPTFTAALAWCDEHHPPPSAYMAAMSSLVKDQKELTMDLKEAERLIGLAVENPSANVPTESLALANATVILRSGLMGITLSQETITVVTTESTNGD